MANPTRRHAAPLPLSMMLRLRGVHLDDDTESGGGGAAVSDEERGSANDDESTSFVNRMAAKYEKEDKADADAEDELDASGDDDEEDDADEEERGAGKSKAKEKKGKAVESDDDDDTEEHPDDDEESDSAADDDEEHPDDAADDDAAEDSDDDEVIDDEDDDEEDEVSAETRAALEGRGADLKLSDVPDEFRPIVQKKLREVDAAFTKAMQEATAFRSERTKLVAENKFREDNPEIVVIELLEKNPDLFDKVNAQLAKNEDQTVAEAFKIVVEKKRNSALKAIEDETQGAERFEARISEVEGLTKKHAESNGIPHWIADQAVGNAISAALREKRDVTNDEIKSAVAAVAKQYKLEHRGEERKKSKEKIKARSEQRRQAPPAVRKPGSAASPGASVSKKGEKVDWNSETSRQSRILDSARRIMPGAR